MSLLRGINVGGRNMLPMAALAGIFEKAGCSEVRTYIQSGNVAFAASSSIAKRVPRAVADAIEKRFGFRPAILVRTSEQIAEVAANNPLLTAHIDIETLHVGFLDRAPDKQAIARLDPSRSPGDRFAVRGSEIYLHLPNGVVKSRLTGPYIDATLAVTSTLRNWRTVLKLAEMMRATTASSEEGIHG